LLPLPLERPKTHRRLFGLLLERSGGLWPSEPGVAGQGGGRPQRGGGGGVNNVQYGGVCGPAGGDGTARWRQLQAWTAGAGRARGRTWATRFLGGGVGPTGDGCPSGKNQLFSP